MDLYVFAFMSMIVIILGILGLIGTEEYWLMACFLGAILGMLIVSSVNSDGSITLAYAYSGGFQSQTTGIWPLTYIPFLFTIFDFGAGFYKVFNRLR